MQKIVLIEHNIRRVFQRLLEIYQPMKRGEEEQYIDFFLAMEGNMLKTAQKDGNCNSRRAREAVDICLASINGYLNQIDYNYSSLSNPANLALVKALQMAYDPLVNPELAAAIDKKWDLNDLVFQKRLFAIPFKCLHRLRDSIDSWMEMGGSNGYIQMIEREFGPHIDRTQEWNWTMQLLE